MTEIKQQKLVYQNTQLQSILSSYGNPNSTVMALLGQHIEEEC